MRLSDIIETYISGDWGNDEPTEDASCPVSCIRGADIVPIYNSEYGNIPLRYISEKSLLPKSLHFWLPFTAVYLLRKYGKAGSASPARAGIVVLRPSEPYSPKPVFAA